MYTHLYFNHLWPHFIPPLQSDKLIPQVYENEKDKEKKRPIPFQFSENDRRFLKLQEANISDTKGNPHKNYQGKCLPPLLSTIEDDLPVIQQLEVFLEQERQLDSIEKSEINLQASCRLKELFLYLIDYAKNPPAVREETHEPPKPIDEIYFGGRSALAFVLIYITCKASKEFFPDLAELETWLKDPLFLKSITFTGYDDDFQIVTESDTNQQLELRARTLDCIAQSLIHFNETQALNELAKKKSYYQQQNLNPIQIKRMALFEFGGLTKRLPFFNGQNNNTILGFKTKRSKPVEIIYLQRDKVNQSLKKDHCFTSDCLKICLKNLVETRDNCKTVEIRTAPFCGVKFLIDRLTGRAGLFDRSLITEEHFVRYLRNFTEKGELFYECEDDLATGNCQLFYESQAR